MRRKTPRTWFNRRFPLRRADDRAVLAAIVYLVQADRSWRKLLANLLGVSRR